MFKIKLLYLSIIVLLFGCSTKIVMNKTAEKSSSIQYKYIRHKSETSTFTGQITDLDSHSSISGAHIYLESIEEKKYYSQYSDKEGKFWIKDLKQGPYNLRVNYSDYQSIEITINIKKSSNCYADVKLYNRPIVTEKPIIYLYPTIKTKLNIQLNYSGTLSHTYPKYLENGWTVTAEPDGRLMDEHNQEYYALFWEGIPNTPIVPEDGFVVSGAETAAFLEEKLAYLGLNRREANEFIMYWLPRMEDNAYNFIHFSGKQYEDMAELQINPNPETLIRVMMITQALLNHIQVPLQDLKPLHKVRNGFTVVEWGGTELKSSIWNHQP